MYAAYYVVKIESPTKVFRDILLTNIAKWKKSIFCKGVKTNDPEVFDEDRSHIW